MNEIGQLDSVKTAFSNRVLYMMIVQPHRVNRAFVNLKFVGLDTVTWKTKKLIVNLECTKFTDPVDFCVVDDSYPYSNPYLFVLLKSSLYIVSLATGLVVKQIKDELL